MGQNGRLAFDGQHFPNTENVLSQGEEERLAILRTYEVVDAKGTATLDNALSIAAHVASCKAAFMVMVDSERLVYKAAFGFVPQSRVRRAVRLVL